MKEFCSECGHKLKEGDFCPNCGAKRRSHKSKSYDDDSYESLIRDILWIRDGSGYRISKAKIVACAFFIGYVFTGMVMMMPSAVRYGFMPFFLDVFIIFVVGLFYYAVCRCIGYLVRRFVIR